MPTSSPFTSTVWTFDPAGLISSALIPSSMVVSSMMREAVAGASRNQEWRLAARQRRTVDGWLHCPQCGTTDPCDWQERAGTPAWCTECEVDITEECGPGCVHPYDAGKWCTFCESRVTTPGSTTCRPCDDVLRRAYERNPQKEGPSMNLTVLRVGGIYTLAPDPRTSNGGGTAFGPSVTRVMIERLPDTPSGDAMVSAQDGPNPGRCQWVAPKYLTPLTPAAPAATNPTEETPQMEEFEFVLSVNAVRKALADHRAKLADAYAAEVTAAEKDLEDAKAYPARLGSYLIELGTMVGIGEIEVSRQGVHSWADKNRTDPLPTEPVRVPVESAESGVTSWRQHAADALEVQDAHIAFAATLAGDTVTLDRTTYESWFVDLP